MRLQRIFALLLGAAAIAGCRGRPDPGGTTSASSASSVATKEAAFEVDGMHCATCPLTVKTAAESVVGVRSARADMDAKRAWVTYDPSKTTPQTIAAAITEAGYPARPADGAK